MSGIDRRTLIGSPDPLALTIYDDFTGYADTASLNGASPKRGAAWTVTGAQGVGIASGFARSTGTGYLYAAGNPDVLTCDVAFSGALTTQPMTMAWSSGYPLDLGGLLHFNFGPTGFNFTVRQDGGSFDTLLGGSWAQPLKADGTVYRFTVAVDGVRAMVLGPHGDSYASVPDDRVRLTRGGSVFWEPNTVGGTDTAKLARIAAYTLSGGMLGAHLHPGQLGSTAAAVQPDQVIGGPGKRWAVISGFEPNTRMPGITFGAPRITTALSSAHSIGANSLVTGSPIPLGASVQIESGNGSETVTTNASPTGTGPYTSTITGTLTKAHAAGVAVIATPAAGSVTFLYYNTENGNFFLPNKPVVVLPGNKLYFGTSLTQFIEYKAADLIGMGTGDSFQVDGTWNGGLLRMGANYLWCDTTGRLRIKGSAPTSETDGTIVGTQT